MSGCRSTGLSLASRDQTNLPNLLESARAASPDVLHPVGFNTATLSPYCDDRRICRRNASLVLSGSGGAAHPLRVGRSDPDLQKSSASGRRGAGCGGAPVMAVTRYLLAELINMLSFPLNIVPEKCWISVCCLYRGCSSAKESSSDDIVSKCGSWRMLTLASGES